MKLRKIAAIMLALALVLAVPATAALDYSSAPSWAQDAYASLEGNGIDLWWADTDGDCNRGSFVRGLVVLIEKLVPYDVLEQYPAVDADYFTDYATSYVLKAVGYGIMEGSLEDGKVYANQSDTINREQAAKMTVSAIDFFEKVMCEVAPQGEPAVYTDASTISGWALEFTNRIASYQIMIGDDDGNFDPQGTLSWPQAIIILSRTFDNLYRGIIESTGGTIIESEMDWSYASSFGYGDYQVARPKTGWADGYYISVDDEGVITAVVVERATEAYNHETEKWETDPASEFYVEKYDADGNVIFSKTVPFELPTFGTVIAGEDCYFVAYGQENSEKDDGVETFRIAKYDSAWELLGTASAYGSNTYTAIPFRAAVPRMALSDDGSTLVLHAARQRYDGHQSNITFILDTETVEFIEVWGEEFPDNHVSHSFGQFVKFDGEHFVTVDHGDAYPRAFVFQHSSDETTNVEVDGGWYYVMPVYGAIDLFEIYGETGENVTNAIGSGFEVSSEGYLFLLCSDTQQGLDEPWNVYLVYTDGISDGYDTSGDGAPVAYDDGVRIIPLTSGDTNINTARLVKFDDDTFAAMWAEGSDIHVQLVDAMGGRIGSEQIFENCPMPPTDPVVIGDEIVWLQEDVNADGVVKLYRIDVR